MKRAYSLFCLGVLSLSWVFPPWVNRYGTDLGFGFLLDPPHSTVGSARVDLAKLVLLDLSICACLAILYGVCTSIPRPVAWRLAVYGPLLALGLGLVIALH